MIPPVWGQAVIAGKSASHWSTIWDEMYVGDSTNLIIHCIIYKFEIVVAHECTPLKILKPITWKTNTEIRVLLLNCGPVFSKMWQICKKNMQNCNKNVT